MISADTRLNNRYATWVLVTLAAVYGFNLMDRYIFVIMMEAIKKDLELSDTQLGLISGFAFSAVYSIAGLAAARWADQSNRRTIIAWALTGWSALTIVCGLVRTFPQLLVARMGIGVFESACSPSACSLLTDVFPPKRRAMAFAVYSGGLYVGLGVGFGLGGWIGEHYGWRAAFIWAGIPGLFLALFVRLFIKEPVRGASDDGSVDMTRYTVQGAAKYMLSRPSFAALMLGSAFFVFAGTAIDTWGPLFLIRARHMVSGEVGLWTGALGAIAGFTGVIAAGWSADRLAVRDPRGYLWVAMGGMALAVPGTIWFVFGPSNMWREIYFVTVFFNSFGLPTTIAITQKLMPIRLRALAAAVMLLGYNLIGTAGCNFVVGFLSDRWFSTLNEMSVGYAMAAAQFAALIGAALIIYGLFRMPRDFGEHFGRPASVFVPMSKP